VPKDVAHEIEQLVERGFGHYARGLLKEALAEWESALRLDPRHRQAKRLVAFAEQRGREIKAGEHVATTKQATVESTIPQCLAALTERKPDVPAGHVGAAEAGSDYAEERWTRHMGGIKAQSEQGSGEFSETPTVTSRDDSWEPDTVEDLPVDTEGLRQSAQELIGECEKALRQNQEGAAALAAELVLQLADRAPAPGVDDIVRSSTDLFEHAFHAYVGNPHACPIRAIPTESIAGEGLDERAAFFMSRMDGMTSIGELIDGSGMAYFDAIRVLASLRRVKAMDLLPPLG
jgi:hypothetical protein